MRIRAIHTFQFAALGTQSFDFKSDWDGVTATRILFSGRNGCGKSTLLKGIAALWTACGYWLHTRSYFQMKDNQAAYTELQRGGIAIHLENVGFDSPDILLYSLRGNIRGDDEDWLQEIRSKNDAVICIGQRAGLSAQLELPINNPKWLEAWAWERQRMLVSPAPSDAPNILFLDAEERRWITPTQGIGEIRADDLTKRWLASYQASEAWETQLESALLTLKIADDARFARLIDHMNTFLIGKQIEKNVILSQNRLRVAVANGLVHSIDALSSGEHQVLIQFYMVERWLERGGIAMIGEPDLYLHPSLINSFLVQLEIMVAERDAQLIITSHIPSVWERYEAIGQRVLLGETQP